MNASAIMPVIYETLQAFNQQVPPEQRVVAAEATVLVGPDGVLDSLAIINLLVMLEDTLSQRLGRRIMLLNEDLISQEDGPLKDIGSLAAYVASQG